MMKMMINHENDDKMELPEFLKKIIDIKNDLIVHRDLLFDDSSILKEIEDKKENIDMSFSKCLYWLKDIETIFHEKIKELIDKKEQEKSQFIELWLMGMKHMGEDHPGFKTRWCVKNQCVIAYSELENHRCWECDDFILNKGICDPL